MDQKLPFSLFMITFFPLSAKESFEHSRTNSRVCLAPCRFQSNKRANKHSSNQAASLVSSLLLSFVPIWGSFSRRKKEKEKEQFGLFLDLWKPWMVGASKKNNPACPSHVPAHASWVILVLLHYLLLLQHRPHSVGLSLSAVEVHIVLFSWKGRWVRWWKK